jgi:hypothetical protein
MALHDDSTRIQQDTKTFSSRNKCVSRNTQQKQEALLPIVLRQLKF